MARKLTQQEVNSILAPLQGLQFSIAGGAAMMMHGMPRETGDVDVMVPDEKTMMEAVKRLGGQAEPLGNELMTGYTVRLPVAGQEPYEVDVIMPHVSGDVAPWAGEASFSKVMPKEWLLLTKLQDPRDKSFNDTLDLFRTMSLDDRKKAWSLLKQHMPHMADDYKSMKEMSKLMPKPALVPQQQAPQPSQQLVAFVRSMLKF